MNKKEFIEKLSLDPSEDFITLAELEIAKAQPFNHEGKSVNEACSIDEDAFDEKIEIQNQMDKPKKMSQFIERLEKHFTKRELAFMLAMEMQK